MLPLSNIDPLFELEQIKENPEKTYEKYEKYDNTQTTFDLLKVEGGAVYLTRDGDETNVIIGPTYIEHFKQMGERGYLRNKALELWELEYREKN